MFSWLSHVLGSFVLPWYGYMQLSVVMPIRSARKPKSSQHFPQCRSAQKLSSYIWVYKGKVNDRERPSREFFLCVLCTLDKLISALLSFSHWLSGKRSTLWPNEIRLLPSTSDTLLWNKTIMSKAGKQGSPARFSSTVD